MRSKLAEDLGLDMPVFAFTHCRDVAAAVSKAGGLGVLGVAGHSKKNLKSELEWIKNEVGGRGCRGHFELWILPTGFNFRNPTRHP